MYYLYFDGGSRGNPGISGCAAVLYDQDMHEVSHTYHYCGDSCTNNHAEWTGLKIGIELAKKMEINFSDIVVRGDSMLVVKQCKGEWKVKDSNLQRIHGDVLTLLKDTTKREQNTISAYFKGVEHVLRNNNSRADELCNKSIDTKSNK